MSQQPYYLPVSRRVADLFLSDGSIPELFIERVGLLSMLVAASKPGMGHPALGRLIVEADASLYKVDASEVAHQLQEMRSEFAHVEPDVLTASLVAQAIEFAPEDKIADRSWCGGNGRYAPSFQEACRATLHEFEFAVDAQDDSGSSELDNDDEPSESPSRRWVKSSGTRDQIVVAKAFMADPYEHFSLTAYAGTGKTHLVFALAEGGRKYTHLAPSRAQQFAFQQRVGSSAIESKTLFELAIGIANKFVQERSTRWVKPPQIRDSNWPFARQAEVTGISGVDGAEPYQVLQDVLAALRNWCHSQDEEISHHHLPRKLKLISSPSKDVYIGYAGRVWDLMFAVDGSKAEQIFSIKIYHLVKWFGLAGASIPPLGTLLVDEAHDLSGGWYHMLSRYQQGLVTMSDPYQSVFSGIGDVEHAKTFRMTQSVRTGEQAMPFVREVLGYHSEKLVAEPIIGSKDHITRPKLYDKGSKLPEEGLRVYGSEWFMLEDALRLKDAGALFRFVPASGDALRSSVMDAINLKKYRDRPKSYHLRTFSSWSELASHLSDIGCPKVVRLFERGFDVEHLEALFKAQSQEVEQRVLLGLLEHCKNLEYSTVMMSNCCFVDTFRKSEKDLFFRSVYVAMTRVHDELWLPGDAMGRLSDIANR